MEEELMRLQKRALEDDEIRAALLKTREADDPLSEFCRVCNELGYKKITPFELATAGEFFCEAMLRSVNGGGREAPDGWDDYYEMFFRAIQK